MIYHIFCRYSHFGSDIEARQLKLLEIYRFKCSCEACENNYKKYDADSQFIDFNFLQEFPENELTRLIKLRDLDSIWKFYDRACKYMEQNGKKSYSVQEMNEMYFVMLRCLTVAVKCREYFN